MRATLYTLGLVALASLSVPARAGLVLNGDFEIVGAGITNSFQLTAGNTTQLPNWVSTSALSCVVFPGTATTNACGGTAPNLWAGTTSPDGGNFFVMDVDNAGTLTQTIAGLIIGQLYDVTFYQAGAEFQPQSGPTFANWNVTFGSAPAQNSSLLSTPAGGFTGWFRETLRFQATSTTQVLTFLAVGSPHGLPPAIALDDLEVTLVPEPGTFALMGAALVMVGVARRRLKKRS